MRIEVPPGGPDALKEAFRGYASSHDLVFTSTWGPDRQPFPSWYPPTLFVTTKREGVAIVIKNVTANGIADIEMETTCYADEAWEPLWREVTAFLAATNYRILESKEIWKFQVQELLKGLSLPPLYPVKIEQ